MINLINLSICSIRVKIQLDSSKKFAPIIRERYQNFLIPSDPPVKAERRRAGEKPVDISLFLKTFSSRFGGFFNNQPVVSSNANGWSIKDSGFHCKISNKNNHLAGSAACREDIYTFDSLLRVLWTQLLLLKNGFLVHASGIRNGSTAYLFPGVSGSGKSTLAKKALRTDVLSDELVGVQVKNRQVLVMGTPFWGEFQQGGWPVSQPLRGIYFLRQSRALNMDKMLPQDALKNLLRLVLFFSNDPGNIKKLLGLAKQCILNTTSYNIFLSKDSSLKDIMVMIDKGKR